jgi:hypothetical protein
MAIKVFTGVQSWDARNSMSESKLKGGTYAKIEGILSKKNSWTSKYDQGVVVVVTEFNDLYQVERELKNNVDRGEEDGAVIVLQTDSNTFSNWRSELENQKLSRDYLNNIVHDDQ